MSEIFRRKYGVPKGAPISFKCPSKTTIYDVLVGRGYRDTGTDSDWDIFWCEHVRSFEEWGRKMFDHCLLEYTQLQSHQRVNHFRNHYELTRKDLLVLNFRRAQEQAERAGQHQEAQCFGACVPTSFVLPLEYGSFVEEFKHHENTDAVWIMKPSGRSRGNGIFLVNDLADVVAWQQGCTRGKLPKAMPLRTRMGVVSNMRTVEDPDDPPTKADETYVVQRYVSNPLLLGGKKFDLRLYVLVISYSPLVVYLYRSGFARLSSVAYTGADDLKNQVMHLTNVAVQKQSRSYDNERGATWDLRQLKLYLGAVIGQPAVAKLLVAIEDVILFSLFAVQKVMMQDSHCFELYGYDILVSSDLKPWLLEVNSSPSLQASTPQDYDFKCSLLDDALTVVNMEGYLSGAETQVGGFDLLYRNGKRFGPPSTASFSSYLGCHNDRREQLCRLAGAGAGVEKRRRHASRLRKQMATRQSLDSPFKRDPNLEEQQEDTVRSVAWSIDASGASAKCQSEAAAERASSAKAATMLPSRLVRERSRSAPLLQQIDISNTNRRRHQRLATVTGKTGPLPQVCTSPPVPSKGARTLIR